MPCNSITTGHRVKQFEVWDFGWVEERGGYLYIHIGLALGMYFSRPFGHPVHLLDIKEHLCNLPVLLTAVFKQSAKVHGSIVLLPE